MTDAQSFLTPEKFEELKVELEHLKTVRRKEIAEALEYARSLGDLSENAEYQEARDMQSAIEERITYLEKTIKEAKIVDEKKKGDVVGLGSAVTIQKDKEKDKSRLYNMNVPVGTWMGTVKVNNDEVWNEYVKTNKVKGFSIEGYFADKMEGPNESVEEKMEIENSKLLESIKEILNAD